MMMTEPCMWTIRDKGVLVGMVILHVDDMVMAGDESSAKFRDTRAFIHDNIQWTAWEHTEFEQCGVKVVQEPDGTIHLSKTKYCQKLKEIEMERSMANSPHLTITARELKLCRGALGAVSWRATQTAPWLQAECSILMSQLAQCRVAVISKVNKLVRELNDTAKVPMTIFL